MEKMPFRPELELQVVERPTIERRIATAPAVVCSDWRQSLPVLTGQQVILRELRASDAPALFAMLTTQEVSRFISPPPSTVDGFERFIAWTIRQRVAGTYVCYAVTLKGFDSAIGIFQVRELEPGFGTAEWGFALGSAFWGMGLFADGAELVLEFVFETLRVHRLEARAAVRNGRGNSALQKMGAVQEGVLRKSFLRNGEYLDQVLYAIVEDDWRARAEVMETSFAINVH
jgi:RimJ/RimL family protein N-acetyltransferase